MRVILFGAKGMVGSSVLHERFFDPKVKAILAHGQGRWHRRVFKDENLLNLSRAETMCGKAP